MENNSNPPMMLINNGLYAPEILSIKKRVIDSEYNLSLFFMELFIFID